MKQRVRAAPPALVRYTEVHDDVDSRPSCIREVSRQIDVSTPLTSDAVHVRCRYLGGCAGGGHPFFVFLFDFYFLSLLKPVKSQKTSSSTQGEEEDILSFVLKNYSFPRPSLSVQTLARHAQDCPPCRRRGHGQRLRPDGGLRPHWPQGSHWCEPLNPQIPPDCFCLGLFEALDVKCGSRLIHWTLGGWRRASS